MAPDIAGDRAPATIEERMNVAEETLRAIRNGEVDALVARDASLAAQVFTLASADRPYRMFVESMRDGAATVSESGVVLYSNRRLAELLGCRLQDIIGAKIALFVSPGDRAAVEGLSELDGGGGTIEAALLARGGRVMPVRIGASILDADGRRLLCLTFADLTEQHDQKREIDRLGRAQTERMRELETAQAALTQQATHDALTGLPNRNLLIARVTEVLHEAKRSQCSIGLIFVDLDSFKAINDTRGHAAGDTVLREVANRLLTVLRPTDSVSRLGGDEFVVLLPSLESPLDAVAVGRRISEAIEPPIQLEQGTVPVTASIGISVSDFSEAGEEPTLDSLLQDADTAMYRAKSLGGSGIKVFDASLRASGHEGWITQIREALDEDRFVLQAQPIVDLATGTVVQQELLLRMRDRDGRLIAPLAFLPTAERCGSIGEIDRWVITQAIEIASRGQRVAVNLSAASAGDPAVLDLIEREIAVHDANPSNLVFEITETAAVQDIDRTKLFAERLVALGCRFALDDFGTGFASFTYLTRLPVQFLKIDMDFVRNVTSSESDRSVVRAIVSLAEDFGQETIAEGVEDEPTADLLQNLGVTFAQGYLFGRPSEIIDEADGEAGQPALALSPGGG